MPKSALHTHAVEMKAARDAKRQLELDDLKRRQDETIELTKLNPRRAIRQPDNGLWEPKARHELDQSIDRAADRYNDFTEQEWAPRLAHTRELVEDLLPRLRGILDAHRAEPYVPAVIPDGPREAIRDAIIAELQKFEDRYASVVAELRAHGQRSKDLKFSELATLAKPYPLLNPEAAAASWRQPMARFRALPELTTAAAVDLTMDELRVLPAKITLWNDTLREHRSASEKVFRALGQLRREIDSTLEGISRNTLARALTTHTLAIPVDPLAYGTARIPQGIPIAREGQVEFD